MILNLIAVIAVILAVLAALGHDAYLGMLYSAANKRAGGAPIAQYVRSRFAIAGLTTAGALISWLFMLGPAPMDVIAILLAGASGTVAGKALQSTQERYRSGG